MTTLQKAKTADVTSLYGVAWRNAEMSGDPYLKRQMVRHAEERSLQHHLPDEAHGLMHEMGVPHNHERMKNDPESGLHAHTVVKAFNPKAFEGQIVKSWGDGDEVHFEGWLSTPDRDQEKDVTEPEAFIPGMDLYFSKRAPLSIEHNGRSIPIGHLQKAAVMRDGKTLKTAVHPTDAADFEYQPQTGSGAWVRGVANEEPGVSALRKGNVGGMSFIGNARNPELLPGGRYRITTIDPWIESTIAAYPINPQAVIAVAKAYGLNPEEEETPTMTLDEILAEAQKQVEAEKQSQAKAEAEAPLTKADLGKYLLEMQQKHEVEIAELKKAIPAAEDVRGQGVGRKGIVQPAQGEKKVLTLEDNPLEYVIEKASGLTDDTSALQPKERAILNELFERTLGYGLTGSDEDE